MLGARTFYEPAGIGPEEVDVIELHDCFTTNEPITYEALGLWGESEGRRLTDEHQMTYGGQWVGKSSGGLLSKGLPLNATGFAQCAELLWHLLGRAEERQVEGASIAVQQNLALGGACVVTIYRRD